MLIPCCRLALRSLVVVLMVSTFGWAAAPYLDRRQLTPEQADFLHQADSVNLNNPLALKMQEVTQRQVESAAKGITVAPEVTSMSTVVIMGDYTDDNMPFTDAEVQDYLFGSNPTGSMTDYFDEVSYGQFQLTGSVHGPYLSDNTKAYYGDGGGMTSNFPYNAAGFIVSILDDADLDVDFAQYDNDGPDGFPNSGDDDGVVDVLTVVCAGGDDNWGDTDNIHPHSSSLTGGGAGAAYVTDDPRNGGGYITINDYTIQQAEKGDGSLDEFRGIGIFAHEFGHKLGITDLYDGDYSTYGAGSWCLMAYGGGGAGSGLTTGHRPTHMSAWCKERLGWVVPTVVSGTETVIIPPVETSPTVYKIWEDGFQDGRYWLIEYRTRTGFDSDIPDDGVLIWHVNEETCSGNRIDDFKLVELVQADGLDEMGSMISPIDAGDLYPGTSANNRFADDTYPAAHDIFGRPTEAVVEDFTLTGGPGSDMQVSLTQRTIVGYTSTHFSDFTYLWGWGSSSPATSYGAIELAIPESGSLVGISFAHFAHTPVAYNIRIFDEMFASSPSGLIQEIAGMFPDYPHYGRYHEVGLESPIELTQGQSLAIDVARGPDNYAVPFVANAYPWSDASYFSNTGVDYVKYSGREILIKARIATDCGDVDADGICLYDDNCPVDPNTGQSDSDADGIGDACDVCPDDPDNDKDGDGFCAASDNCPGVANPLQEDRDGSGIGDACECTEPVHMYTGESEYDYFGWEVSAVGDMNQDGYDDFFVGAQYNDMFGTNAGKAYVYSGFTGEPLYVFYGEAAYDNFGCDGGSVGDLNNDGYDDIVIGAASNDAGGPEAGRAYVFFGQPGPYPVSSLASVADMTLTGEDAGDSFGWQVASTADIDGDGRREIVVGAPQIISASTGKVYVYSGATGSQLYEFTGKAPGNWFGYSLDDAGDVNNDELGDVVIGAFKADAGEIQSGEVYVFCGAAEAYPVDRHASAADIIVPGPTVLASLGTSVAGAGDINNDGYDDIIAGAYRVGQAYVYSGLDGSVMWSWSGPGLFGYSVTGVGDIDGDGWGDLAVGSPWSSEDIPHLGNVQIFSGATGNLLKAISTDVYDDWFGRHLASGLDVNRDGISDLVIGAFNDPTAGASAGRAYLYHLGFDADGDYELAGCDNCTRLANPSQSDGDDDGIGDACESCCFIRVGDANSSGDDEPTIGDVSLLIDAKFISDDCETMVPCKAEADVNQSGGLTPVCDDITIGDISTLIDYLFITGPDIATLPDCL